MSIPPKMKEQVLHELQIQTEAWLEVASHQDIQEHLAALHGVLVEDLPAIECGRWMGSQSPSCTSCPCCEEFILALMSVAITRRPDLTSIKA